MSDATITGDRSSISATPSSITAASFTIDNLASTTVYHWKSDSPTSSAPSGVASWSSRTTGHTVNVPGPIGHTSYLLMNTTGAGKPGMTTITMTKGDAM